MAIISGWWRSKECRMPFEFKPLEMHGLVLVRPRVFGDDRGFFFELYKHSDFANGGIREHLVQDNYSRSAKAVLRGLHYQKNPRAQGKLVMCLKGGIFDVAVDIRRNSPQYGQWVGMELTEANRTMLYVPAGFAHGFQVLSDTAEVLYKCTDEYSSADERGIIWNDPDINIAWPLRDPVLSEKDMINPLFKEADNDFIIDRTA
jgi:dTDP-4-dehydrorhamnose 3,5-epimerase